jgi:SAM-dependent methyltransferase
VGLPDFICQATIETIIDLGQLQAGNLVLEIGAGTGQIGYGFRATALQYVGLDLSAEMLDQFRQRLEGEPLERMRLVHTDGNQPWPVADGSTHAIFSSRAIHLMDLNHAADEVFRIAQPAGAVLLLGKVKRAKDSVKDLIKEAMQERLGETGFKGRRGERGQRQMLDLCCQRGATAIDPVQVGKWSVSSTPRQSIESWQEKEGLAGINPPEQVKQEILADLLDWAKATFGDLDRQIESQESYMIQGVKICQ